MRRRALLGTLGALGVAGCLRLDSAEETTVDEQTTAAATEATKTEATSTDTTTASESTREETTERPQEVSYPVGVSDDGANGFLFDSHTRSLSGTSCRTSWRKLNHTEGTIAWEKTYDVDSGVAFGEWTASGGGTVEMFRSGNEGLWREDAGGESVYGEDEVGFEWSKVSWEEEVGPQLTAWDWGTPERVNESRPAEWEVTATSIADSSSPPGYLAESVRSLDGATMRVNEDGVILELRAKYTVDEGGDSGQILTYESLFRTRAIGEVSVSEPSWVPTARERVPESTAAYVNDRQFVEFTLESGGPLLANSNIVLVPESGSSDRRRVELDRPLEQGTTAYLWHDESDPYREARISRGSPPSDASPITLPDPLEVYLYRDARQYSPPLRVE